MALPRRVSSFPPHIKYIKVMQIMPNRSFKQEIQIPQNIQDAHGTPQNKVIVVIPARYQSSRFPGKPLAKLLGKPMIQWVYERVLLTDGLDNVFVATDDERIFNCVKSFGGEAIMTGECSCGTDRIYQAIKYFSCDIVVNVQGDEPTIDPSEISQLIHAFDDPSVKMATLKKRIIEPEDIDNPNVVKVITNLNNDALYFSRNRIPCDIRSEESVSYFRHIGVYAYKKDFLEVFVKLPLSTHERIEKLEQLRALDNGYKIRVLETEFDNIGVDSEEDIIKAEEAIKTLQELK